MEWNIKGTQMVPANEIKAGDILIQPSPKTHDQLIELPVVRTRVDERGKLIITVRIANEHRATPAVTETDLKNIYIPADHATDGLPVKA